MIMMKNVKNVKNTKNMKNVFMIMNNIKKL